MHTVLELTNLSHVNAAFHKKGNFAKDFATHGCKICAVYLLPVDEALNKLANVVGPTVLIIDVICTQQWMS